MWKASRWSKRVRYVLVVDVRGGGGGGRVTVLNSANSVNARTLRIVRRRPSLCRPCTLATGGQIRLLVTRTEGFRPRIIIVTGRTGCTRLGRTLDSLPVGICTNASTVYRVIRTKPVSVILATVIKCTKLGPAVGTVHTHGTVTLTGGRALIITNRLVGRLTRRCHAPVLPMSSRRSTIFRYLTKRMNGPVRGIVLATSNNPFHACALRRLGAIAGARTLGRPG